MCMYKKRFSQTEVGSRFNSQIHSLQMLQLQAKVLSKTNNLPFESVSSTSSKVVVITSPMGNGDASNDEDNDLEKLIEAERGVKRKADGSEAETGPNDWSKEVAERVVSNDEIQTDTDVGQAKKQCIKGMKNAENNSKNKRNSSKADEDSVTMKVVKSEVLSTTDELTGSEQEEEGEKKEPSIRPWTCVATDLMQHTKTLMSGMIVEKTQDVEGKTKTLYHCCMCSAGYEDRKDVLDHLEKQHYKSGCPRLPDMALFLPKIVCGICGKDDLEHIKLHFTNQYSFNCEKCSEIVNLETKEDLIAHKGFHRDGGTEHKCIKCWNFFWTKPTFDLHRVLSSKCSNVQVDQLQTNEESVDNMIENEIKCEPNS